MPKRPRIGFPIDEKQHEEIKHYARLKGHDTPGAFARWAVFSAMRKNPLHDKEKLDSGSAERGEGQE